MQPIPLPAPFGGINDNLPVIALQSPQCEALYNFNINQAGTVLRNGDSIASIFNSSVNAAGTLLFGKYGNSLLLAVTVDAVTGAIKLYNAFTGALVYTSVAVGGSLSYTNTLYFNKYLFIFIPDAAHSPGYYYNGTTYGVIGYTGSGLLPAGGDVYNNRAYIIQYNSAEYWYSEISAISGALTKVDLSSIINTFGYLYIISTVTLADTVESVTLQTFVFNTGEVLFYTGSYPNAADWRLVGRATIGSPLSFNTCVEYQGDSLVMTNNGVISLRDLFLKGSEQASNLTVNANISKSWRIMTTLNALTPAPVGKIRAVWDANNTRLIFSFPYYTDASGDGVAGSYYFILNTQLQSWSVHRSYGVTSTSATIADIVNFDSLIYMIVGGINARTKVTIYKKEGASGFTDRNDLDTAEVAYDYELKSAPIPLSRGSVNKISGVDVILKSDMYDVTNYQLIGEFGAKTTTAQKIPTQASTLVNTYANIGIEATYTQYKISGTTTTGKTVGYQLYGTTIWVEPGTSPR